MMREEDEANATMTESRSLDSAGTGEDFRHEKGVNACEKGVGTMVEGSRLEFVHVRHRNCCIHFHKLFSSVVDSAGGISVW